MSIEEVRDLVRSLSYTVRSHVIRHMLEEGFEKNHCIEALLNGRIIEDYSSENRCLIVGRFTWSEGITDHLHVVVDYGDHDWLDLVTAYIPRPPAWITPDRRRGV